MEQRSVKMTIEGMAEMTNDESQRRKRRVVKLNDDDANKKPTNKEEVSHGTNSTYRTADQGH